jgi:uncharacterized SAM-binding protein YcdF (DUF218 family)
MLIGIAVLLVGVLALLSTTAIAVWRAAHNDEARRISHADIIIVLGAAQYNGRPSPVFQERLAHAVLLYNEHFATRVMVVGGGQPGDATTEGQAGADWLVQQGLPAADTIAEPVGNDTLQSLRGAADYMRRHGYRSAFLVSDPWHNLRIRRMARDLGIEAFVSADFHSAAVSHWTRFSGYARETLAYLYYRILGR